MQHAFPAVANPWSPPARPPVVLRQVHPAPSPDDSGDISEGLARLAEHLPVQRRLVHAGDFIYAAGERFTQLFVLNAGCCKTISGSGDGREKVVGLHFRGDWLGFDGIGAGRYACDSVAMETGQVWCLDYEALIAAGLKHPPLLAMLHGEMSRQIVRDRDAMLSLCTLQTDARVADFLRGWAESLARRGMRTDQIRVRMTRAEIGNYLGMTLESVSRSLSRLVRDGLIQFATENRREIQILDLPGLNDLIEGGPRPHGVTVQ